MGAARWNIGECPSDIGAVQYPPRDDAKCAMIQSTHQGVIFSSPARAVCL